MESRTTIGSTWYRLALVLGVAVVMGLSSGQVLGAWDDTDPEITTLDGVEATTNPSPGKNVRINATGDLDVVGGNAILINVADKTLTLITGASAANSGAFDAVLFTDVGTIVSDGIIATDTGNAEDQNVINFSGGAGDVTNSANGIIQGGTDMNDTGILLSAGGVVSNAGTINQVDVAVAATVGASDTLGVTNTGTITTEGAAGASSIAIEALATAGAVNINGTGGTINVTGGDATVVDDDGGEATGVDVSAAAATVTVTMGTTTIVAGAGNNDGDGGYAVGVDAIDAVSGATLIIANTGVMTVTAGAGGAGAGDAAGGEAKGIDVTGSAADVSVTITNSGAMTVIGGAGNGTGNGGSVTAIDASTSAGGVIVTNTADIIATAGVAGGTGTDGIAKGIVTGAGDDTITNSAAITVAADENAIETGAGADTVNLNSGSDITGIVTTGDDGDTLNVSMATDTVDVTSVTTGAGDDTVNVTGDAHDGNLFTAAGGISTDAGADTVTYTNANIAADLTTGAGDDAVTATDSDVAGNLSTGDGDDAVALTDVTLTGDVDLGAAATGTTGDSLTATNSTITGDLTHGTGAGMKSEISLDDTDVTGKVVGTDADETLNMTNGATVTEAVGDAVTFGIGTNALTMTSSTIEATAAGASAVVGGAGPDTMTITGSTIKNDDAAGGVTVDLGNGLNVLTATGSHITANSNTDTAILGGSGVDTISILNLSDITGDIDLATNDGGNDIVTITNSALDGSLLLNATGGATVTLDQATITGTIDASAGANDTVVLTGSALSLNNMRLNGVETLVKDGTGTWNLSYGGNITPTAVTTVNINEGVFTIDVGSIFNQVGDLTIGDTAGETSATMNVDGTYNITGNVLLEEVSTLNVTSAVTFNLTGDIDVTDGSSLLVPTGGVFDASGTVTVGSTRLDDDLEVVASVLDVDGTFTAADVININAGGLIRGDGTVTFTGVGGLTIAEDATLALAGIATGPVTMTVAGDVLIEDGATVAATFVTEGVDPNQILTATDITLEDNVNFEISVNDIGELAVGAYVYDMLTATGTLVTGDPATWNVNDPASPLVTYAVGAAASSVTATVTVDTFGTLVTGSSATVAANVDAGRAADIFTAGFNGLFDGIIENDTENNGGIDFDEAKIQSVFDNLNPEELMTSSTTSMIALSGFDGGMSGRLGNIRAGSGPIGMSAPVGPGGPIESDDYMGNGLGVWLDAILSGGTQDGANGCQGYDYNSYGFIVGYDMIVHDWVVGISGGYLDTGVDFDDNVSKTSTESYHVGLYAGYSNDAYYFDTSLSYGNGNIEMDRRVEVFTAGVGQSETDSDMFSCSLSGGYKLGKNNWIFTPTAGIRYAHMEVDGFSEDLTVLGPWGVTVGDMDFDSFLASIGLRVGYMYDNGLQLEGRISYVHEFADTDRSLTARFNDAAAVDFVVDSVPVDEGSVIIGTGIVYLAPGVEGWDSNVNLYLDYDVELRDDFVGNTLTAGIRLEY